MTRRATAQQRNIEEEQRRTRGGAQHIGRTPMPVVAERGGRCRLPPVPVHWQSGAPAAHRFR
ncbi:hypothetical protein BSLA_02f1468 [Burkholderia stabilis]|nr:hypothetical protein BSLA_02f1468 [Burkholderia stabilis]